MTLHARPATEADLAQIADIAAAAFHPDTDAISRHLFPAHLQDASGEEEEDPVRSWRLVRKGIKLRLENTVMMVVVDDELGGRVVGFSLWDTPAGGDEPRSAVSAQAPSPLLDQAAFAELHHVLDADVREHFGVGGIKDVFREFSSCPLDVAAMSFI